MNTLSRKTSLVIFLLFVISVPTFVFNTFFERLPDSFTDLTTLTLMHGIWMFILFTVLNQNVGTETLDEDFI